MGPNIYKPDQGYYTRVSSAIAFGLIALMAGAWMREQVKGIRIAGVQPVYIQAAAFVIVVLFCGAFIYYLIGRKKRTVDFMIATEGEMKKVNWSNRREIMGMTWVVIGLTVLIAILLTFFDYVVYSPFFQWINVIES